MESIKTVIIGDIHGRPFWKDIIEKESPDRVIFIGDYFDSLDYTVTEQIYNFEEIVRYKESKEPGSVIMLIGNHDHHYYPGINNTQTSGYQTNVAFTIKYIMQQNVKHLQAAYSFDNILCTHAGVGRTFLETNGWSEGMDIADFLNELLYYKPNSFLFNGIEPSGDSTTQTPIWIRPRSLMRDAKSFKKQIVQVVGHTRQNQIDIKGKSTGGRYYFIDTLGTSGEYLIYENKVFSVGSLKESNYI